MGCYQLRSNMAIAQLESYAIKVWDEAAWCAGPAFQWNYELRNPQVGNDESLWPFSWTKPAFNSAGGSWVCVNAMDTGRVVSPWEPVLQTAGCLKPQFIYGQILDSNSNPISGATILCFVTATNVLDSTCVSDANGYYQAPCYQSGNHYLVAYETDSPDLAGTTVNTLTPQN